MKFQYKCVSSDICSPIQVILRPGKYYIECYGAQGGKSLVNGNPIYSGGKGAYTAGILLLRKKLPLYLYIGGKGSDAERPKQIIPGGWNGGGSGQYEENDDDDTGAGGGSTDIRLVFGEWNETKSLNSRIMVAAGGSGSCFCADGNPGGDITGYIRGSCSEKDYKPSNTNQTHGYKFGIGENGRSVDGNPQAFTPYSGSGSGYYGGTIRYPSLPTGFEGFYGASSSGSSYVSGYEECNSISEEGVHTGSSIHFSSYYFLNPVIKNGMSEFPSFEDSSTVIGHEGNGAIRITLISPQTGHCYLRNHISFLFFLFCFGS